jgi:hypothetical protein
MKSVPKYWKARRAGALLLLAVVATGGAVAKDEPLVARAKAVNAGPALGTTTNAPLTAKAILEQPLPQSVFVVPRKVVEGKDPFNPRSTRVYATETPKAAPKPSLTSELVLRGISGSADRPLAIINTTTFATGDSLEIAVKDGRLQLTCAEINVAAGTVLIQVGEEQRVLRLQP